MSLTLKKLSAAMAPLYPRYGFVGAVSIERDASSHFIVTLLSAGGRTVRVQGVPFTTPTADQHVAQNVLKAARAALRQDRYLAAYRGGK